MSVSYDPFSAHWTFPFEKLPSTGRTWRHGGCIFGARRSEGRRAHAGCDVLRREGTPILAISDGRVIRVERRFTGDDKGNFVTDALWVEHDTYVVRYGEIRPGSALGKDGKKLTNGSQVFQGDPIAVVGLVGTPQMLHFEVYWNDVDGELSNPWNRGSKAKYRFVKARDYQRRSDLLDPTPFLDRMADRSGL